MKLGKLSLACVLGMSTLVFAGCTNNGVTTKNAHPARVIDGQNTYRFNGLNDRNGLGTLNAPGYRNSNYFGTDGFRTNGYYGTGTTRYSGPTATPGYGMTGNGMTGTYNNNTFGTTGTGTNGFGTNGTMTSRTPSMTGYSTPGTTGTTGFGSSASSYNGTMGTSSLNNSRIHGLSMMNNHVLQLGNLTIVGSKNGSHASRTTSFGTRSFNTNGMTGVGTSSTSGTGSSLAGRLGTTSRVMTVNDSRAVEAIDRVNRMLSSPSTIRAKSQSLAKDLSYILKKASEASPSGTTTAAHTGTSHR